MDIGLRQRYDDIYSTRAKPAAIFFFFVSLSLSYTHPIVSGK